MCWTYSTEPSLRNWGVLLLEKMMNLCMLPNLEKKRNMNTDVIRVLVVDGIVKQGVQR